MIYAASIQYYDPADSTVKTFYAATHGFSTSPSSTPANTAFVARIENPALIRRDIFDVGTTGGASRVGYGELVLRNDDGGLDWLNDVALDGRALTIRYCASALAYPGSWSTLFVGTMEQAEIALDTVKIRVRDRQVFATAAFQSNRYGGTNTLPAGVDGLETDLKGKAIPVVLGAVYNVTPYCVNTSKLIYQLHDGANWGALRDVTAVYDAGALLTPGDDYASQAAMEATAPSAGEYRKWKAGGMIRLGSSPYGEVTCDAIQGTTPSDRTAGALFRVVALAAGISSGNISSADITALDALNHATLGLYVKDDTTNAAVLDDIARTVGAWWASDAAGVLRIKRLNAPSGSAALALSGDQIEDGTLQRIPLNDGGLPVWRVTVRGVPNYTVQTSGLVGSVASARRARLAQPYQDASDSDTAVQTAYLLAPELSVETKFACLGQCALEATRLLTLYSAKRDRFELVVNADSAALAALDLGAVISITYPRFGLDAGKLFRVLGFQLDPTQSSAALTVWG